MRATTRTRPGFCKAAALDEIEAAGFTLSPGRYVGAPESEEDQIAFEERIATLVNWLATRWRRTSDSLLRSSGLWRARAMKSEWITASVAELEADGTILVQDGNHSSTGRDGMNWILLARPTSERRTSATPA